GKIRARRVIVTTHFPFINKHGSYYLKLYQHRSYVIALANAQDVNGMYVDESKKGLSFRNHNDLLLLGGGAHRTGKKGGAWKELCEFAARKYPDAVIKYSWATQDCMSLDDIPYVGQYSKNTPDMFTASGFNKWGMTGSMLSAMLLSDMVLGTENDYASVFSPSRSILKPQLFVNGFEATTNLLTPSKKRCPHLGCALKWNANEHSWDCACHGSRFSEDGKVLDNPSNGDLKKG
ncbi:MAG: FAD-dependent oxidoreductase, partial [Oscillospiraceae bacterium]